MLNTAQSTFFTVNTPLLVPWSISICMCIYFIYTYFKNRPKETIKKIIISIICSISLTLLIFGLTRPNIEQHNAIVLMITTPPLLIILMYLVLIVLLIYKYIRTRDKQHLKNLSVCTILVILFVILTFGLTTRSSSIGRALLANDPTLRDISPGRETLEWYRDNVVVPVLTKFTT